MDPNWNIYEAPEDEIPLADKARLEGYLKALDDTEARARANLAEKLRRIREELGDA